MLLVGGDGPDAKVVDLLIRGVGDLTGIVSALRLEDADGLALALDGAALRVDGFDVLVEENHRGGILVIIGRVCLGGIQAPLRDRLIVFAKYVGVCRVAGQHQQSRCQDV